MQKIMVIMLFWLLMPFYSWAISLEEIQSHPERYVKMDESRSCINYIDAESIHSLRCDPPYYTLLGDVYYVGRSDNLIFKMTEVFCYDYQRSRRELAKSIQLRDRNISYDQLNKAIFEELIQNTGIVGSVISNKAYNTAGTFLQDVPTNKFRNNKIRLNAPNSHDADYMFYRYYGQHFWY